MLCATLATSTSAESLTKYIEPDVEFFVLVPSLAETREQWATHPVAEIFADEAIQELMGFTASEAEVSDDEPSGFTQVMNQEFGLTWDELLELFPGQMALMFYNLSDSLLQTGERHQGVLMAEFSADEDRLNTLMQIQFERNAKAQKAVNPVVEHTLIEESFMGETLYMDETFNGEVTYIEDGFALVDGIFLLGSEERLRRAVELIKEGGAAIDTTATYQRSREASGGGDLQLYVNLSSMLYPLNDALMAKFFEGGMAMLGVTAQSVESALSLQSIDAAFIDLELTESGGLAHGGILYNEKSGLLRMVAYGDGSLPEAAYIPESVVATTISTFDIGEMLVELEKVLAVANPSVPLLLNIQLQRLKAETGVDFRGSILENLSGDVVTVSVLKEVLRGGEGPSVEQMYVIGIQDGAALSQALEALKDIIPGAREMIETQEYEGQTIHTFKGLAGPTQRNAPVNDFSYAITRSELIVNVGRIGLLQEVLSLMVHSESGFWQMDSTEDLFEMIEQPMAVSRSYMDLEQMVQPILTSVVAASSARGINSGIDLSKMPLDLDLPLLLISETNEAADGIFTRAYIFKRGDAK